MLQYLAVNIIVTLCNVSLDRLFKPKLCVEISSWIILNHWLCPGNVKGEISALINQSLLRTGARLSD